MTDKYKDHYVLAKQVADWARERDRLNYLIAHATGHPAEAQQSEAVALTDERIADAIPQSATTLNGERRKVCMTLDELRHFAHALITPASSNRGGEAESVPEPTRIDAAPMYKALIESRLALLAVNSAASQKAISLIDAVINVAPAPASQSAEPVALTDEHTNALQSALQDSRYGDEPKQVESPHEQRERVQFEQAFPRLEKERDSRGHYDRHLTRLAWQGWLARAILAHSAPSATSKESLHVAPSASPSPAQGAHGLRDN